jgi:hypothetical protein
MEKIRKYQDRNFLISLRMNNLNPNVIQFLKSFEGKKRSEWIKKAIGFYYSYEKYKKAFLIKIIQENYSLSKHLLRQIGANGSREP